MWTYPKFIAHRGGGTLAPENTLAGLRCALAYGFTAVEFDVMGVAGDDLVLMHDTQLGRTVLGNGPVARLSAAELGRMDAGSWLGERWRGEPVPTFAEAAAFCVDHRLWMNAEIKPVPGLEADTGRRVAQACRALPVGSVLLSSFSVEALVAAREAAPTVPRALLVGAVPNDWKDRLQLLGAVALHVAADRLSPRQAGAIKAAGFGLMAYTVNQPERVRALFAIGTDAVCTDRLDLVGVGNRSGSSRG